MNDVILASIITGSISLIGSISTLLAQSRLTQYRIQRLEEKVDKHNSIMERTCILERDVARMQKDYDRLKGD